MTASTGRAAAAQRQNLHAKLVPPAAVPSGVPRSAIIEAVCGPRARRFVLVRAPAGFGKTTTMRECADHFAALGVPTVWVTLDRSDNDASRFLGVLEAALATLPGLEGEAGDAEAGPAGLGSAALQLMRRIASHPEPFALFLDDFEVIHEPGVQSLVRELMESLPRWTHLVIGSRNLPELRLGRLRAQGQLLEVEADQLRFTLDETREFFAGLSTQAALSAEDVEQLHAKTEGWAAALWLAFLALERSPSPASFIARFSGTDRAVADYLAEEVLARQVPAVRDFLLRTSVLKQLEPGICDFVLERKDSEVLLTELETTNAMLVRVGEGEPSYRYHAMFGGFLRQQLAREQPDAGPRLHRRAADWYLSHGRPVPAIDHALEGGDVALATELIEANAASLLAQGRLRILSRWLEALPPAVLQERPELMAVRIWAVCFTRGSREASELLARSGLAERADPRTRSHLLALQPLLLAMRDHFDEAYAAGRENLAQLPTDNAFADMVLANAMTTMAAVLGRQDEARRLLDSARRRQGAGGSSFNIMYSEAAEGIIDLQEGRLRQAAARFKLALNATEGQTHGNAWAGVLYASTCYEANELVQTAHLLHVYLPIARDVQLTDEMISGYVLLSRIAFLKGDVDHAFQALTELEYLGHQRQLPRLVATAHLERSRLHLRQGHATAAREELQRADDAPLWQQAAQLRMIANDVDYLALARLRWEAVAGDAAEAARGLADEIATAQAGGRERRALKLKLLRAITLYRDERRPAAFTLFHEVLRTASAEGYLRLLVDEGLPAGALLRAYLAGAPERPQGEGDPIFQEYLQRLREAFAAENTLGETAAAGEAPQLAEPMTRKELRVIQLLAEGYSNSAIAEKLFVSDSTVRTHLRKINTKLGVHSRTQAVAMARRCGLIE
ncbi:helix-turn-helix transcriptional regulator [Ramlibacter sp. G-1-2-2]|uniref:Helix-turn-helix transcriptional regulator n=2 Tax=Ramlibacter agri TaxID=2728837 RepID=A0A848H9T9_9BURK|nr:helix-turn-helix transcriptional regulator [Ramlibacter agri]